MLLILAGVTISALGGDNGILKNAGRAKEETEISEERENVQLSVVGGLAKDNGGEIKRNYLNEELTNYIGQEGTDYTLSKSAPFIVKYLDSERSYIIDENGKVSEYESIDLSEYLKVGDYVNYNPTIADKSGTPVEENKLTYTSQTGNGTEHGSGYKYRGENTTQKFTATADMKWRLLSIENGTVQLISENPITTDAGGNFTMSGAIGYLYAERELNEICKIYGYRYGADTSQITTYTYGGPADGELTGKIIGSGARSITIEDINKHAGINTEEDLKELDSNYGSTENPTVEIKYPTISTNNGNSGSAGIKNLKYTYYYNSRKIENTNIQNMIFNGSYWLASKCIYPSSDSSLYCVRTIASNI